MSDRLNLALSACRGTNVNSQDAQEPLDNIANGLQRIAAGTSSLDIAIRGLAAPAALRLRERTCPRVGGAGAPLAF